MEFRGKLRTLFENISQVVSAGWLLKKHVIFLPFRIHLLSLMRHSHWFLSVWVILIISRFLILKCHFSCFIISVNTTLKKWVCYHHNNNNNNYYYYYYWSFCAEYTWLFFTCIFYLLLAVWVFFSCWFSLPHYNDTGKSHDCHVIITCFLFRRYWTATCLTILILLYCYK